LRRRLAAFICLCMLVPAGSPRLAAGNPAPRRTPYPPAVIKSYEAGNKNDSVVGEVYFRAADHQLVRPVFIVRGKKPVDMKNKEDFWEVVETVPGAGLMQGPDTFGCQLGDYT